MKMEFNYIFVPMSETVKKGIVGRPRGDEKEPMNFYIRKTRAKKLRDLAAKEQKTISIMVENALESTYGI